MLNLDDTKELLPSLLSESLISSVFSPLFVDGMVVRLTLSKPD